MKKELQQLARHIYHNKSYLKRVYPNSMSLLNQIEMILQSNMSEQRMSQWFEVNCYAIKILKEYLEQNNKNHIA
jgi:translation initiation factor 2B subunit (eIF-2B alpha/beta/delta family)